LLSNKIYCYGGATQANELSDSTINVLDIVSNSGNTADELKDKWMTITSNTNGLNIQLKHSPQGMQLPDGKTMLSSGDLSDTYSPSTPMTLAFDSETYSWSSYPEYTEPNFGKRQM
jgi:hypothetical protein